MHVVISAGAKTEQVDGVYAVSPVACGGVDTSYLTDVVLVAVERSHTGIWHIRQVPL